MKHITIALVICLLAYSTYLLSSNKSATDADGLNAQDQVESAKPTPEDLAPIETAEARTVAKTAPEAIPTQSSPLCIVLGVLQSELGDPVPDASVTLSGYQEWSQGIEAQRLPGRHDSYGFATTSDANGAFRFEVPVPTVPFTTLRVVGCRFFDSAVFQFGNTGSRLPAITEGTRDLGIIPLVRTGAIAGRVVDESGQPLAEVKISITAGHAQALGGNALTQADGTYLLEHAPGGTYGAKAFLDGYLQNLQEPITVAVGKDTTGIDFVLQPAPTIEGWVHDQDGAPLEGVQVTGTSGARATTDKQGHFTLYLTQIARHVLQAKKEGYSNWRTTGDRTKFQFSPGKTDLRITLHALPKTQFLVLDEESGKPLQAFGIRIDLDKGIRAKFSSFSGKARPQVKEHPSGMAEVPCREGVDLYLIAADGYPLAAGAVKWDVAGHPRQTVRLNRGATVQGRVLRDDNPVAHASVTIVQVGPATLPTDSGNPDGDSSMPSQLYERASTKFRTRTDAQGRFALHGLHGAMQRLTVTPEEGAPLVVGPWLLKPKEALDLGDLLLTEGARVTGSVLLPPGVEPAGLEVFFGDRRSAVKQVLDTSGRFEFEDLPNRKLKFQLGGRPGFLESGAKASVRVKPGRNRTRGDRRQGFRPVPRIPDCRIPRFLSKGRLGLSHINHRAQQGDLLSAAGQLQRGVRICTGLGTFLGQGAERRV